MKSLLLLTFFCFSLVSLSAQKPKEIRELNLKTKTTWLTIKKGKKELNYKSSELRYDKSGDLIEIIEFNTKGDVTRHIAYQYNDKKLTREIHFDKEGKIVQRIEYIFSRNVLSEIKYFNSDSILEKKEQFIYEQQD